MEPNYPSYPCPPSQQSYFRPENYFPEKITDYYDVYGFPQLSFPQPSFPCSLPLTERISGIVRCSLYQLYAIQLQNKVLTARCRNQENPSSNEVKKVRKIRKQYSQDWICDHCRNLNFAKRKQCNRCLCKRK